MAVMPARESTVASNPLVANSRPTAGPTTSVPTRLKLPTLALRIAVSIAGYGLPEISTRLLEIGYLESGPADGPPVILLHGWPSDPHDWDGVAPALAGACRGGGGERAGCGSAGQRDGETDIFVTGRYLDLYRIRDQGAKLAERIVVCDSSRINTLLALPL